MGWVSVKRWILHKKAQIIYYCYTTTYYRRRAFKKQKRKQKKKNKSFKRNNFSFSSNNIRKKKPQNNKETNKFSILTHSIISSSLLLYYLHITFPSFLCTNSPYSECNTDSSIILLTGYSGTIMKWLSTWLLQDCCKIVTRLQVQGVKAKKCSFWITVDGNSSLSYFVQWLQLSCNNLGCSHFIIVPAFLYFYSKASYTEKRLMMLRIFKRTI